MNEHQHYDKHKRNQEARSFYKSKAWQTCRALVLLRDHHLCQDCLARQKITQAEMVHHIVELLDDLSLALDPDNLVSLCNSCHNKRHPEKGGGKRKAEPKRKVTVIKSKANEERM